ncbi:MAG: DUF2845 domain-containing protein [Desulfuromonadales bacterium]|nr:MAG: DUF2845 domain-containing protein [Desulfuromonadales bacterium]
MLTLVTVAVLSGAAGGSESGSMRCSGGMVSLGDFIAEVVKKCGQPDFAYQREQTKVDGRWRHYRSRTIGTITVDDWTYNFGPNEFMYQLIFENGRVARIESLEWGY